MVDQKLIDYVKDALEQGQSADAMRQILIKEGWSAADIDGAIASVQKTPAKPKQAVTGIGILGKFKQAFTSPGQLFEAVKPEHDLNSAVKYYALMLIIPFAVAIIITLASPTFLTGLSSVFSIFAGSLSGFLILFVLLGVTVIVAFYFICFLLSFSLAGFFHVFAMLFRAEKKGFAQTYKSFSYALPPCIVGSIVVMVMTLLIPGETIAIIIVTLFFTAWYLFVGIIGLSHLHGISKIRAALVVIVPIVIVIVVVLLIQYVLLPMLIQGILAGLMGGLGNLTV